MNRGLFYGQPVPCHWAGWTSDTIQLARAGWQISAREDHRMNRMSLAIRHPEGDLHGISDFIDPKYEKRQMSHMHLSFRLQLARRIDFRVVGEFAHGWSPVDPYPSYSSEGIYSLEDLAWFRKLPEPDNDIIVTPPSMEEILKMALDHQAPKQKELREKARRQMQQPPAAGIIRLAS